MASMIPEQVTEASDVRGDSGEVNSPAQFRSPWRLILGTFLENKLAMMGLVYILAVLLFCFVGPLFHHTNQVQANPTNINLPPGGKYLLGTDNNGFDILGRLMEGGQRSLEIGVAVALISTAAGMLWGALSGFAGGIVDAVMSRILDIFISLPAIFVFIYLATVYRPSLLLLIIVLSGLSWLVPARLVRGETLSLRTREFVKAAKVMGGGSVGIIARHILRNVTGTLVVAVTFQIADAILILATLDFFGFGLPPPTPSWGGILSGGINYLYDGYWWQIYPVAFLIATTVVAFSLIGDALRDSLEVRLQRR
jgi:peptide/nickel transport system permease protein